MKKIIKFLIFIIVIVIILFFINIKKDYSYYYDNNIRSIDINNNGTLSIRKGTFVKLNISNNIFVPLYNWDSSNNNVVGIDNGIIKANDVGSSTIKAYFFNDIIMTKINVYDVKKILIIVGDSRMDNFKDDNEFLTTNKKEIRYDKTSMLNNYERIYVVSLSGMRYNWLVGLDQYKNENATKYVADLINDYENKINDTTNYDIKIIFNLGVNDLNHKYLDTTPSDIASKYLNSLYSLMDNEWSSDKLEKISLNFVTLFPVNDNQISCYFPNRYNSDVIEFNNYIFNNSKFSICDAYNDLNFSDDVFRKREQKKGCSDRDGLHFSEEFNKDVLYNYLINNCGNK